MMSLSAKSHPLTLFKSDTLRLNLFLIGSDRIFSEKEVSLKAMKSIKNDIVFLFSCLFVFESGGGCVRSIDNLRYFYYCGLVQIGLKKYKEAMEALTMVCTSPSENVSLIQIDSYKKYILCSLIRKQRFVPLPRYTPRVLTRYFPKLCQEYLDLNKAFDSKANSEVIGRETLRKTVEKNIEVYLKVCCLERSCCDGVP